MVQGLNKVVIAVGMLCCFSGVYAEEIETEVDVGGAVRLNYSWRDYGDDANGTFDIELFRVDFAATHGQWFLDAQYRWYQGFEAVHHAEVGYNLSETDKIILGVTQVPFGIEPYASHSFWFGGTYYLGFEDDYDAGLKWRRDNEKWTIDVAYFANSEYGDSSRFGRYSFDVASVEQRENTEDGQLNVRVQHKWGAHKIGASIEAGRFTNNPSLSDGQHWAAAAHFDGHWGDWNIQVQLLQYEYESKEGLGTGDDRIALSAFEFPFEVSTEGQVSSLNVAKTFNINNNFVDSITCYNDNTYIKVPGQANLSDSIQNVTGCLLAKGGLYTYVDWIAGKNMWFAGGPGIGISAGRSAWQSRLNINVGFYF